MSCHFNLFHSLIFLFPLVQLEKSENSIDRGGFGRRVGGSVRVSSRDPRLPPLIPPPVNIQIASPVDEDASGPNQDIFDLFQQATNEDVDVKHAPRTHSNDQQTNSVTNSPQLNRHPGNRRSSYSVSPKHKQVLQRANPTIEQQSILNRMEQRYHTGGRNVDELQYHATLGERRSSPAMGSSWQHGQDYRNPRPNHPDQPAPQTFDDQFDEFVYKSKHIAHCEPNNSAMTSIQVCWEDGSEAIAGMLYT